MINIQPVFSSFIAEEMLTLDNKLLEEACYDILNGGIKADINFTDPRFKELLDQVGDRFNQVHQQLGFMPFVKQEIQQAWVNINRHKSINSPHRHPHYMLSACYYVKADDISDMLEFITPITALQYVIPTHMVSEYNNYNSASWAVPPVPGKLVIFPSWLMHYVRLNDSKNDRISIAFNTNITMGTQ